MVMETRRSKRGSEAKKYKRCDYDFVEDKSELNDAMESLVGLDEILVPHDVDLAPDSETDWLENRPEPEFEIETEIEQTHDQDLINLRVLECNHDLPVDLNETIQEYKSRKYFRRDNTEANWVAPVGPLSIPESNLEMLCHG